MKRSFVRKLAVCALALTVVAGIAACGSDSGVTTTPQGQVVKSIVVGAKIVDKDGKTLTASTGVDGKFNLGAGPYTSTGGVYTDMTGTVRNAPTLMAEAGSKNITAITTLYANADAATRAKLDALCASAGLDPDSVVTGTLSTDKLAGFAQLNEVIGELLTEAAEHGYTAAQLATYAASLATAITTNVTSLSTPVTTATLMGVVTSVQTSFTVDTTKVTSVSNACVKGGTIPDPPQPTGTTGGTTGGTSKN